MEVAVGEQLFADALFVTISGDTAVGQYDGAATTGLEKLDKENDKEVRGFPAAKRLWEVRLDPVGD